LALPQRLILARDLEQTSLSTWSYIPGMILIIAIAVRPVMVLPPGLVFVPNLGSAAGLVASRFFHSISAFNNWPDFALHPDSLSAMVGNPICHLV